MIYFTSDTHFCHNKSFLYEPRGFNDIKEHDNQIIQNWNSLIKPDDDVYHLGDVMLLNNELGIKYLQSLNGKIHIILGNHCTAIREELYRNCSNVVEVCLAKILKIKKQHYFLCHYPTITANYDDKPYHQHLINLYGHTHQQHLFYNDNPFMYNVGMDAHNCEPVSIEQIDKDIHEKVQECYKIKMEEERLQREYYDYGIGWFERHPLGEGILDNDEIAKFDK